MSMNASSMKRPMYSVIVCVVLTLAMAVNAFALPFDYKTTNLDNVSIVSDSTVVSTLSITKMNIKAGKTRGLDSISFTGLLDYTENNANSILIVLNADDMTQPLNFTFPINIYTIKKGKYIYKDSTKSLTFDSKTKKVAFSAKNLDLTGMDCPITITVTIGNYKVEVVAGETVVNGAKRCPLQLVMYVKNSLTVTKASVKHGKTAGTDSFTAQGTFTIDGSADKNNPLVITLDTQTFTVPGNLFPPGKAGIESCKKASSTGGAIVDAKFDFVKCTYTISIKNASITPNSNAAFGINCFGASLDGFATVNLN